MQKGARIGRVYKGKAPSTSKSSQWAIFLMTGMVVVEQVGGKGCLILDNVGMAAFVEALVDLWRVISKALLG